MFKKSYKGRRVKLAAKKSLTVPVAIVTSFIVVLAVSLSTLINKGLVNAFSDSVTPTPSPTSTATESTADLVKSSTISSNKEKKANKENVEESKPQSETRSEIVETPQQSQSETVTTSTETTPTPDKGTAPAVAASGNSSAILSNGNTAGEIGSYAAAQMAAATGVPQSTWESIIARESNGDHTAANGSGASGLFQTMPGWGSTATVEDQIQSALNAYNAQGLSAWNY